ncbi:hypothetical protein DFP72DRAFT_903844 [Ephemerocybe angulata]|uniref:Uncharacterized protein n=1 Tax=Ephemerocybe angulata TaxID=980116 RepID=A0A8H6M373_9AGAR|nr:hypothetical protein DFP72DRAFT_903844 [Tulosesus angulatus]
MTDQTSTLFIPLEIVRQIVEASYDSEPARLIGDLRHIKNESDLSTKPPWKALASLSSGSKAYREICLETWFETLRISSPGDVKSGCRLFPMLPKWTTTLHCMLPKSLQPGELVDLRVLGKLEVVRLDLPLLQYSDTKLPGSPFEWFHNKIPSSVVELIIDAPLPTFGHTHFRPSPPFFDGIKKFKNLKILRFRSRYTWCDLCNTSGPLEIRPPYPTRIAFENGTGLPMQYHNILSCLKQLETVSLTVQIFPRDTPHWKAYPLLLVDNAASNPLLWSGECCDCTIPGSSPASFVREWVSFKKREIAEFVGVRGTRYRYKDIPSLKRVEWLFTEHIGDLAEGESPESSEIESDIDSDID